MCARYELAIEDPAAFEDAFGVQAPRQPVITAHPGAVMPIILLDGARMLVDARWGLIPAWARDATIARSTFNARAETVALKPAFRDSFARTRCIVPATRFFEWAGEPKRKTRYVCAPTRTPYLALAGLDSAWRDPDGQLHRTFTVLTTTANTTLAAIHDRMPVILDRAALSLWLDPQTPHAVLGTLLCPAPPDALALAPDTAEV